MGDFKTQFSIGTFQYCDGSYTAFSGAEVRYGEKNWYVGAGGYVASNAFNDRYGLLDLRGKLSYDSNNIFEQNLRVRTTCDPNVKATQIRYSPFTVNIPITDNVSIYSNTHYSGKYNYDEKKWTHSIGNFTGLNCKINKNNSIAFEAQRYNLQDITDNSPKNWSFNAIYTHNL